MLASILNEKVTGATEHNFQPLESLMQPLRHAPLLDLLKLPVQPSKKQLGNYVIGTNLYAKCFSCQKINPLAICNKCLPTFENASINYYFVKC